MRTEGPMMEWHEEERNHLRGVAELLPARPPARWFDSLLRAQTAAALDRSREQLERHWRARARQPSQQLLRSPPYDQRRPMPGGGEAHFTYERSLWPRPLEERKPAVPPGWEAEVVGVRSRRAALWTFLVTVRDLLRQNLTVRTWGLDEDDLHLLELLASPRWKWSQAWGQATLHHGLAEGRGGLYLLASVSADGAERLDMAQLARAWSERRPEDGAVLLLDTSLSPGFDILAFLASLARPPLLVAELVELNPWHSLGLNLGRGAWLRLYGLAGPGFTECQTAAELGRRVRSVVGTALSYPELCQFDVPFLGEHPAYMQRVLDNNRQLAARLGTSTQTAFVGPRPSGQPLGGLAHCCRAAGWRRGPSWEKLAGSRPAVPSTRPPKPRPGLWPDAKTRARYLAQADRQSWDPEELEGRLRGPVPPGWEAQGLLFRSGMAAISAVLAMLEKLGVSMQAHYFETRFLHHVTGLEPAPALFLEAVEYNWELRTLEIPEQLPSVTVVDTTLTGERFPVERLLQNGLVIRLFSALKLHQMGLELENAGALVVYSNQGQTAQVSGWLREARRLTDTGLTGVEASRLRADFFLRDTEHAERIFANNAWLAQGLRVHPGLVARVVHPSLTGTQAWAVAPFVVLHLADEAIDNHRLLTSVLEHEIRRRRLPFVRGASFGFEAHRHEFIIPVLRENRALFKLAMGSGPGREAVLELLNEVCAHPSFAALRAAWPALEPAEPPSDWATPSQAMLEYLEAQ